MFKIYREILTLSKIGRSLRNREISHVCIILNMYYTEVWLVMFRVKFVFELHKLGEKIIL